MVEAVEPEKKLEILSRPIQLDLRVNDLRIIVGCFRAVAYLMKIEDEPYLDAEALELQERLERTYEQVLARGDEDRVSQLPLL